MSKKYQARDNTNRSHKISFRLSDDEYEHLSIVCEALGITYSQYLRRAALTARIDRPIVQITLGEESARELGAQFGKIGGLLNQIARKLNSGDERTEKMMVDIDRIINRMDEGLRFLKSMEDVNGHLETPERS